MAEDNGLVRIEFLGAAEPVLADIARVRRDLAELQKEARAGLGIVPGAYEAKYTDAVRAGASARTKIRRDEVTEQMRIDAQMRKMFESREAEELKTLLAAKEAEKKANLNSANAANIALDERSAQMRKMFAEKELAETNALRKTATTTAKEVELYEAANAKIVRSQEVQAAKNAELLRRQVAETEAANAKIVRSQEAAIAKMTRAQEMQMADIAAARRAEGTAAFAGFRERAAMEPMERQRGGFWSNLFGGMGGSVAGEAEAKTAGIAKLSLGRHVVQQIPGLGQGAPMSGIGGFAPFLAMGGHPVMAGGVATAAVAGAWVYEVQKQGGAYQKVVANMGAQTDMTKAQIDAFALSGRKLAMTFGTDAKENVEGFRLLINAFGLDLAKHQPEVNGMMETANKFAIAGNIELPEAINTLITSYNALGYSIHGPGGAAQALKDINDLANLMANAFTQGQVQADRMNAALQKTGAIAGTSGLSMKELAAILETAGKSQLTGQQIGTGVRNTLLGLAAPQPNTVKAFKALGINPESVNPTINGQGATAVTNLLDDLNKIVATHKHGAEEVLSIEEKIAGKRQATVIEFLRKNEDVYETIKKQLGAADDLDRMYKAQADTIDRKEKVIGKKIEDVLLGAFDGPGFNKVLTDIGNLANKLVADEPDIAKATSALIGFLDWLIRAGNHLLPNPTTPEETTYRAQQRTSRTTYPDQISDADMVQYLKTGIVPQHGTAPLGPGATALQAHDYVPYAGDAATQAAYAKYFPKPARPKLIDDGADNAPDKKALAAAKRARKTAFDKAEDAAYAVHATSLADIQAHIDDLTDAEVKKKIQAADQAFDQARLDAKKKYGERSAQVDDENAKESLRIATEASDERAAQAEKDEQAETEHLERMSKLFQQSFTDQAAAIERTKTLREQTEDRDNAGIKNEGVRAVAELKTKYQRELAALDAKRAASTDTKEIAAVIADQTSLTHEYNRALADQAAANNKVKDSFDGVTDAVRGVGAALSDGSEQWKQWGDAAGIIIGTLIHELFALGGGAKGTSSGGNAGQGSAGNALSSMFGYKAPNMAPITPRASGLNWMPHYSAHDLIGYANGGYVGGLPGFADGGYPDPWAPGGAYGVPTPGGDLSSSANAQVTDPANPTMNAGLMKTLGSIPIAGPIANFINQELHGPGAKYNWNGSTTKQGPWKPGLGLIGALAPQLVSLIPGIGPILAPVVGAGLNAAGVNTTEQKQSLFASNGPLGLGQGGLSMLGGIAQGVQAGANFSAPTTGASGFSGAASTFGSWASGTFGTGGWTGRGGKYEPAGIVHRGEFVFDADSTSKIGVRALHTLMKRARGYADGGYVDGGASHASSPLDHSGVHDRLDTLIAAVNKPQRSYVTTGDLYSGSLVGQQETGLISL